MRLPNGFGSVHKLSGKRRNPWRARKTDGWVYVDKKTKEEINVTKDTDMNTVQVKQKYVTIGYYPTRVAAMQALVDYNKDPYDLHADTITFSECYEKWSNEHFPKVSESNRKGYRAAYLLCHDIKNMRIQDIKLDHMQKIVDKSGKNYPTLRKLKVLLGMVFDYAVKHEIVNSNKRELVRYVDIKSAGNPNGFDRKPFSKKEIEILWNTVDSDEYLQFPLILIYTGLRIGEFWNLKKEDVHIEERWIYIRNAKTEAGIREVPICEKIVPFFEHWLKKDCEYIFCNKRGEKFLDRNFRDSYWKPKMELLNFNHKPHDTRHTCVSLLTEAGVDERIIKKIIGHKGHGVTETVYTHIELKMKLDAINRI